EGNVAETIRRFELEYMGRSSKCVRVYLAGDIAVARASGILSPAERQLAATEEGRILIKQLWVKEMEGLKAVLRYQLEYLVAVPVAGLTVDIDPEQDEWLAVARLRREPKLG
ncbi:MAG: Na-translocating system protein MpsC family protein, partial [Bacillota bacterium]